MVRDVLRGGADAVKGLVTTPGGARSGDGRVPPGSSVGARQYGDAMGLVLLSLRDDNARERQRWEHEDEVGPMGFTPWALGRGPAGLRQCVDARGKELWVRREVAGAVRVASRSEEVYSEAVASERSRRCGFATSGMPSLSARGGPEQQSGEPGLKWGCMGRTEGALGDDPCRRSETA